jgi:hypothetical protein
MHVHEVALGRDAEEDEQGLHVADPAVCEYVPDGQIVQLVAATAPVVLL